MGYRKNCSDQIISFLFDSCFNLSGSDIIPVNMRAKQ